jgi:acyl carrier protein
MAIAERTKRIIAEQLGVHEHEVTNESHIIDDLGADSLDIVELVMTLEEEFDVEVPDERVEDVRTVEDIIGVIQELNPEADAA